MKNLILILSTSSSLFFSCSGPKSDSSKTKSGPDTKSEIVYIQKINSHWGTCKYQDVVNEVLRQAMLYDLQKLNLEESMLSDKYIDKFDPEYTSPDVTKYIESEIESFISALSRKDFRTMKKDKFKENARKEVKTSVVDSIQSIDSSVQVSADTIRN